jgi:uncharacterized protein with NAD-binding domain and iron-sulfur cluster
MTKSVVVLGGGVAGLSAAHELARRGYRVSVFESRSDLGGKAASQVLRGTGTGGRRDLPGEHGFRFYPAFYKHLIRTMEEIPLDPAAPNSASVADNLRPCAEAGIAPADGRGLRRFLRRKPSGFFDIADTLEMFFKDLAVSAGDMGRFGKRLLRYLTASKRRRIEKFEPISWWRFVDGDRYDAKFQKYLRAVPRIMVAMDPRAGSARTIGDISMQLIEDYGKEGSTSDRTLIGPTSEKWIDPWRAYLEHLGVQFYLGAGVTGLDFDPAARRVTGARVRGQSASIEADYFVLAAPLEVAVGLVTDQMANADGELAKLKAIGDDGLTDASGVVGEASPKMVDWMVGVQFYLNEDVPMLRGHVFYPDSPWALSSISQAQFWALSGDGRFRKRYGDGEVGGILSVDVSDWNREGVFVKKPAKLCSAEEIRREVWEQLKAGVNTPDMALLTDDLLDARWNLDQEIEFPQVAPARPRNRAPLLVHPPGSWFRRPRAESSVENLLLASDYVQTDTILACMEGANEAARRAVNAILKRDGFQGQPCALWELRENPIFDQAKRLDEVAYTSGVRAIGQVAPGLQELWEEDPWDKPVNPDDVRRLQAQIVALPQVP